VAEIVTGGHRSLQKLGGLTHEVRSRSKSEVQEALKPLTQGRLIAVLECLADEVAIRRVNAVDYALHSLAVLCPRHDLIRGGDPVKAFESLD